MAYTKQTWVDNNTAYPVSAARMNYMEDGIDDADNRVAVLEGQNLNTRVTTLEGVPAGISPNTVDAKGDLIAGTADNTVGRIAVGADGQVLTASAASPTGLAWVTPTVSGATGIPATIVDTKGDLIVATAADTVARFAAGSNGLVLKTDNTTASGLVWSTDQGATAIQKGTLLSKGDIIAASGAGTPIRVAAGANGQVLQSDSTAAAGVSWTPAAQQSMTKITEITLLSDTASLDFTSIPQTYNHLRLVAKIRSTRASMSNTGGRCRLNGLTGSGYFTSYNIHGSGSNQGAQSGPDNSAYIGQIPASTARAGNFSNLVIDIPYYRDSTFEKNAQAKNWMDDGTTSPMPMYETNFLYFLGGTPLTTGITSISLFDDILGTLKAGSRAVLYGLQ